MTNNEILQSDLLDILFENRNKAYGAYALRKNYNDRLHLALGISLGLAALLLFMNSKKEKTWDNGPGKPEIIVHTYAIQKDKTEQPQQRKQKSEPRTAQVKAAAQIKIVPNDIKTDIPDIKELKDAVPSDQTRSGLSFTDGTPSNTNNGSESGSSKKDDEPEKEVILTQSDAQFPGGKDAFAKFLTRNLITPDELGAGEKKMVLVRFKVDVDGTISKMEIIQTDGNNYSQEVLRVLAKMPKWMPAMQNGNKVATWFMQTVTFIGLEQ